MAKWAQQYRMTEGQYGLMVIQETGLCLAADAPAIESGCTRRFELVPVPNASGAVLKSLDGTAPQMTMIKPDTTAQTYRCVKAGGVCNPYAPVQTDGPLKGQAVLIYQVTWQQVGGVS